MEQRSPTPNHPTDEIPLDEVTTTFVPKTNLGRRRLALRAEIVRSGTLLLTREALDREITERRGGVRLRQYEELHGPRSTYERWDTVTHNLIGAYDTEAAALAVVSAAILTHGPTYADKIALVHEDPAGNVHTFALGPDLARRAASPITPRLDTPGRLKT